MRPSRLGGPFLLACVLGLAAPAGATSVGGTLYIKARNTRLMGSASFEAKVVAVLQPGLGVVWKGADASAKRFHLVACPDGKQGYVFQSNLSTEKPKFALTAMTKGGGGTETEAQAFASSGAATKALSTGAYELGKSRSPDALADLLAAETLARQVTTKELASHAQSIGLFSVVGSEESAEPPAAESPSKAGAGKSRPGKKPPKRSKKP